MATYKNQATISYNGLVTPSNITTSEVVEVVSVIKTPLTENYTPGGNVSYAVTVSNTGTSALSGLTLSDDLGGYDFAGNTVVPLEYVEGSIRLFVDGVPQAAPTVSGKAPITVTGINIPAGAVAMLIYEARVTDYAPPAEDGVITNRVTLSGPGIANPVNAEASVNASDEPVLAINKSVSPVTVAENGTQTFTFDIQNTGNTAVDAATGAVVNDTFDPVLSALNVTYNGTPWAEGINYTYNAETGEFATIPGQITVPAATYEQDAETGTYNVTPGISTLVVSGTLGG